MDDFRVEIAWDQPGKFSALHTEAVECPGSNYQLGAHEELEKREKDFQLG